MKKLLALVLVLCCIAPMALANTSGMAVYTTVSKATNATADKDGSYEINSNICTIVLDDEGKIVDVWFDVAQNKVAFNAAGEAKTAAGTVIPSKFEKKEAYGMKPASPISAEWYEQARALELFCIGKTVAEVMGTALEGGYPADADLKAGCTMKVADLLTALFMAAQNAR